MQFILFYKWALLLFVYPGVRLENLMWFEITDLEMLCVSSRFCLFLGIKANKEHFVSKQDWKAIIGLLQNVSLVLS